MSRLVERLISKYLMISEGVSKSDLSRLTKALRNALGDPKFVPSVEGTEEGLFLSVDKKHKSKLLSAFKKAKMPLTQVDDINDPDSIDRYPAYSEEGNSIEIVMDEYGIDYLFAKFK